MMRGLIRDKLNDPAASCTVFKDKGSSPHEKMDRYAHLAPERLRYAVARLENVAS